MDSTAPTVTAEEMRARMVRFRDMPPRPKPGAGELPEEVVEFMTADANYSYLAPAMAGQSIIQRYAALNGGDAGNAISVSLAVCSPGRGPTLHAHLNTVVVNAPDVAEQITERFGSDAVARLEKLGRTFYIPAS